MSIILELDKTSSYSKPNPSKTDSEWFIPIREKCDLCRGYGRKPIYKNIYQLYYHSKRTHSNELESEWRFRISQLLSEVRKTK